MANFNARVLGVLLNDEGDEVLLVKRAPSTSSGPGAEDHIGWEFCGGGIEHGESPEDALAREYREELSIEIEPLQIFNARTSNRAGGPLLNLSYVCRQISGNIKLTNEHVEYKWVALSQLKSYDLGKHANQDRDLFIAISAGSGMMDEDE